MNWICKCGAANDEALLRCRTCGGLHPDVTTTPTAPAPPRLRPTVPAWVAALSAFAIRWLWMTVAVATVRDNGEAADRVNASLWLLVVLEAAVVALCAWFLTELIRYERVIHRTKDVAMPATLCFVALQLVYTVALAAAGGTDFGLLWLSAHAAALTAVFCAVVWRDLRTHKHSPETTSRAGAEQV